MNPTVASHIDRVVATLQRMLVGLSPSPPEDAIPPGAAARHALEEALAIGAGEMDGSGGPTPDRVLAVRFGLTPIELQILWLASAPHLDPSLQDAICRANDNIMRDRVDPALCLRLFCDHRSHALEMLSLLAPGARLLQSGLLKLEPKERSLNNRLFYDLTPGEHVPPYLSGVRTLSPSALPFATWAAPTINLEELPFDPQVTESLWPMLRNFYERPGLREGRFDVGGLHAPEGVCAVLQGPGGSGRTTLVKAMAGSMGRHLILVDGRLLLHAPLADAQACLETTFREAEVFGDIVCLRNAGEVVAPGHALAPIMAQALDRRRVGMVICMPATDPLDESLEAIVVLKQTMNTAHHLSTPQELWMANFPERHADAGQVDFETLSQRISLNPLQVRKATHLSYLLGEAAESSEHTVDVDLPLFERAAKAQVSRSIGRMAVVSEPQLGFDDLVLDEETLDKVRAVISAASNRRMVLDDWRVGERIRRGTGIISLFDGPPGTGKTHAAEVIASSLGLSLVRINVASVVDKYIGETEKNLTRIFDQARPDISLLLFDEADSLFSKRTTDVSKAVDRYSNMDINVMLQLIERYPGVTILTTNLKQAIDKAFERRFTFKIHFKLPESEQREGIWRYLLPEHVATAEPIDYQTVADVELSGGEIKNAILIGCYKAALDGGGLTTKHLIAAAEQEAAAAGRVVRRSSVDDDDF